MITPIRSAEVARSAAQELRARGMIVPPVARLIHPPTTPGRPIPLHTIAVAHRHMTVDPRRATILTRINLQKKWASVHFFVYISRYFY